MFNFKKAKPSCVSVQDSLAVDVMQSTANHGENTPQFGHVGEEMEKGKRWISGVDQLIKNHWTTV